MAHDADDVMLDFNAIGAVGPDVTLVKAAVIPHVATIETSTTTTIPTAITTSQGVVTTALAAALATILAAITAAQGIITAAITTSQGVITAAITASQTVLAAVIGPTGSGFAGVVITTGVKFTSGTFPVNWPTKWMLCVYQTGGVTSWDVRLEGLPAAGGTGSTWSAIAQHTNATPGDDLMVWADIGLVSQYRIRVAGLVLGLGTNISVGWAFR